MVTDFGPRFDDNLRSHRSDIIEAALDSDMFHYMKDNCLTAFPDAVLSFVGNPSWGWMVWHMSLSAQVEGAVDEATDGIPLVGWAVDKVTDVAGVATASTCFVRKFPSPITGNVPDLPYIQDDAGVVWDIKEDSGTPAEKLAKWEGRVDDLIDKWGTLPDPQALLAQADRFTVAAKSVTSERDDSQFVNDDYEVPLDSLKNNYALKGFAFEAFKSRYAVSGPLVTHNLREHMMNVGGYVASDSALIQQVRESCHALVAATPAAMASTHPEFGLGPIPGITDIANALANEETRGDAAVALFFVVAGAVVGTVAAAASGGTSLALLAGVTGAGLTAITGLEGVVQENTAAVPDLANGADHPDDVWNNLTDQLRDLDSAFATEEGKLSGYAQETLDKLGGIIVQPPDRTVSLPWFGGIDVTVTPDEAIGAGHDDAATLQDNDVIMDTAQPDQYSAEGVQATEGDVAHARDWLIAIADIIFVASKNSWVSTGGFSRAAGLGDDPSEMISGAADELELRLRNHASMMDDGADALWEVWLDFRQTDQLSQANINRLYGVGDDAILDQPSLDELEVRTQGQTVG